MEEDLKNQHQEELDMLEEDIQAMGEPTIKFSASLLNKKCKLKHLIGYIFVRCWFVYTVLYWQMFDRFKFPWCYILKVGVVFDKKKSGY